VCYIVSDMSNTRQTIFRSAAGRIGEAVEGVLIAGAVVVLLTLLAVLFSL
jgi:hypothetical protein